MSKKVIKDRKIEINSFNRSAKKYQNHYARDLHCWIVIANDEEHVFSVGEKKNGKKERKMALS